MMITPSRKHSLCNGSDGGSSKSRMASQVTLSQQSKYTLSEKAKVSKSCVNTSHLPNQQIQNSSAHSLRPLNEDLLTHSLSMKTVSINEEKEKSLPRSVLAKHLRLVAKKRREFLQIQRVLTRQQNSYIDMYAQLRDLETRSGVEPEAVGDVRLVTVTGWPSYDLLLLLRSDAYILEYEGVTGAIGPAVLKEMKSQLSTIPEEVLNLGADLMARRLEIIEFLRSKQRMERGSNSAEWKTKNAEFDKESEKLHKLVVDLAKELESKVLHCLQIAKTAWLDRDTLIKKLDRLKKEILITQNKLIANETKDAPGDKANKVQEEKPAPDPKLVVAPSYTKLKEELYKERNARESLKQVVSSAEGMLRTARARIGVLERQLKDTRAQLDSSIKKHKEYETLHRYRETSYDVRSKKLLEVSKNDEVTIEMLSLQRDALELRVKELQNQTKTIGQDYEAREAQQKARLEALQAKITEQEKHRGKAESRVQELEICVKDLQEQNNSLKEYSNRLIQLDNTRCVDYLPRKESEPTQTETELWKELQATKIKLDRVSEELRRSRDDKESLLNSLSRIAQEGPVENKMANELVNREQTIFNLQRLMEDLKATIKSMEADIKRKDDQLRSLKIEIVRLRNYECCTNDDIDDSTHSTQPDLAAEVIDLTAQVAALTRERASLVTAVASRALMLERHERCAELFAQITRARHELAARLEGRSEHRLTQEPLSNVNLTPSLSTACKSAAETWTELRKERERVLRLKNVVMSQNAQLERGSYMRTQLEQRRAILERIFLTRPNPAQCTLKERSSIHFRNSTAFCVDEE